MVGTFFFPCEVNELFWIVFQNNAILHAAQSFSPVCLVHNHDCGGDCYCLQQLIPYPNIHRWNHIEICTYKNNHIYMYKHTYRHIHTYTLQFNEHQRTHPQTHMYMNRRTCLKLTRNYSISADVTTHIWINKDIIYLSRIERVCLYMLE